jgi:hypothetical protein
MLSQTAVAQKCDAAAKSHARPFVVEWDATDLASFEAKAQSNTLFVHYEGCNIDVLYECKDPNIHAKFGNFGVPQFTSGTIQGFDIKNEGDLYAKLPLGAATLQGRVSAGETLHLKYFVSGVAMSSRDTLYRGEIQSVPGCERRRTSSRRTTSVRSSSRAPRGPRARGLYRWPPRSEPSGA